MTCSIVKHSFITTSLESVAFALLTQLPRVRILFLPRFFLLLSSWTVDRTHQVLLQGSLQMQLTEKA